MLFFKLRYRGGVLTARGVKNFIASELVAQRSLPFDATQNRRQRLNHLSLLIGQQIERLPDEAHAALASSEGAAIAAGGMEVPPEPVGLTGVGRGFLKC